MSVSSDIYSREILNNVSIQFNRYFSIFIFLFGTIGNILNCFVLSQPTLRVNPCIFLFLMSSIANMISILFGLTTRILAGWNMDITDTNIFFCKFRAFIMFVSRTIALWLIAFATIDRWFSSCSQYQRRQMSSLKNAQRGTICTIVLSIIFYSQIIYCYDANMMSTPLHCYGKTVMCRLSTDVTYALITVLFPLSIMCIFGVMTISNIRQTYYVILFKRKITETDNENRKTLTLTNGQRARWKRIDRYLRHVLFVQIILLTILTLPQVIEKIYTTLTINTTKSSLHITIDKFIYNFVLLLTYLASGMPFYIYTLSGGSMFRTTLKNLIRSIFKNN
ncbi:unnamed protein product [Rotaria sp. Silwood1]|nr:unnamed protein product [Rotaria sp. Silwood1]CAF3749071.1 unnamed protein product [Rotaria sp. Silwood1]CAF3865493.1 unnamed protein product [Rotaria sp. Silwood1]CAF4671302.1 unnamed protein product [Rotaria sp. Silwood1]CAF4725392.1 unnamed protein product [Rotaria sp. Silwood1]